MRTKEKDMQDQIQALSMRLDTAVADVLAKNALVEQYKAMLEEAKANENDYKKYQQYEEKFRHLDKVLKKVDQKLKQFIPSQVEGQDGSLRFDFQTLQPYLCPPDTQLVFSREAIGSGCYGAVYKVNFNGRVCIGKKLYNVLKYASDETPSHCYKNFVRECILMSRAHHPNVVAFIGVHYGQDQYDLTLLMEKLHCDLGYYLEHTPNIPLCTKVSLLHDVSCGLLYLHEECSIIHRDLSAANILLTKENQAKIADLGVSKIIGIDVQKMTNAPGAQAYMSPEALQGKPYDKSLDIFSFGVVTLYVAIQKFPPFSHDNVPDLVILKGEGEVYKRQEWISKMEQNQPELTFLTVWCLKDGPQLRPSTVCLNILLEEMRDECL